MLCTIFTYGMSLKNSTSKNHRMVALLKSQCVHFTTLLYTRINTKKITAFLQQNEKVLKKNNNDKTCKEWKSAIEVGVGHHSCKQRLAE